MDNYNLNVYLARLRLYENLPIYNVGMAYRTPNNKLDIDDYLIATITMAIPNYSNLDDLIKIFKNKYTQIGTDNYFTGNENEMTKDIIEYAKNEIMINSLTKKMAKINNTNF